MTNLSLLHLDVEKIFSFARNFAKKANKMYTVQYMNIVYTRTTVLNLDLLFSKQYHILAVIRIRLVLNKLKLIKTFFVCFNFRNNFAFLRFKWEKPFFWPRIGIFWTPVSNLLSYSGYIEVTVRLKSVFDVSPIFFLSTRARGKFVTWDESNSLRILHFLCTEFMQCSLFLVAFSLLCFLFLFNGISKEE